ncbi:YtxH domain-containing protein [Candidatus Saccharibacteria bacterium]|nr:YtxH domain-containing protein [Candidatus Saccharibacteria bacterium]
MAEKKAKKQDSGNGKFILGAALGAIGGAIAGVLFAPKSGKETRKDIADGTKKVAKKAKATGKKAVAAGKKDVQAAKKAVAKKTTKK